MITQGARVGRGRGRRRGHHPEPVDPGHRRRDRRGAGPGSRPALVAWRCRPSRRREFPGGEFFLPCVLVIKRLDRRAAPRQGAAERHPPRARGLRVTAGVPERPARAGRPRWSAIPSVSHHEAAMADRVEAALRALPVARRRARRRQRGGPHRARAGPRGWCSPVTSTPSRRSTATRSRGSRATRSTASGAVDMKGGLAVLLHLAGSLPEPAVDVTWCFYVVRGGRAAAQRARSPLRAAARPARRRRRDPRRAHRWAWSRPGARARCGSESTLARPPGPHGPTLDRAQRHPPPRPGARRRSPATRAAGRCSTAASTPSSSRRSGSEGGVAGNVVPDRGRRSLVNHRFAPDRDRRRGRGRGPRNCSPATSSPATGGRWSTRPPAHRPALDHPVLAAPGGGHRARRRGPSWAGPTWPPSGRTGSRPPTSARATRCWPTPPASMSRRRARAARGGARTHCCGPAGSASRAPASAQSRRRTVTTLP